MSYELYEVWAESDDGHEELIETTKSLKEARILAKQALEEFPAAIIYKETEEGDTDVIERLTLE